MSLTFLSKRSPDTKAFPPLKGPRKGASLPCSPKWGPNGNNQNDSVFGYGRFLGEGCNSKCFFDCQNNIIYIAIYIYIYIYILTVSGQFHGVSQNLMLSVFYFKPYVKLWKSTIITALELIALL